MVHGSLPEARKAWLGIFDDGEHTESLPLQGCCRNAALDARKCTGDLFSIEGKHGTLEPLEHANAAADSPQETTDA